MIKYGKGYKYQLREDYREWVNIKPIDNIMTKWIDLTRNGFLLIREGYAWDGPSGPTFDTDNFMEGSLVHDALYQLMRMELIPQSRRKEADRELHRICREKGMSRFRAWYILRAVRKGASFAADPKNRKKIYVIE